MGPLRTQVGCVFRLILFRVCMTVKKYKCVACVCVCWRKGKASSPGADCPLSEFASVCSSELRFGSSPAASLSLHRLRSSEEEKKTAQIV